LPIDISVTDHGGFQTHLKRFRTLRGDVVFQGPVNKPATLPARRKPINTPYGGIRQNNVDAF
jgi:hypothetical protein